VSAVVDFVGDVLGGVADAVGDVIEWVGDGISDVVDFVADEIIKPVANFVGDTIDALMDNPIETIAKIAAVATGNAWAIPLIDGASVAANGGDIGDVLKATAISYVASAVGGEVGSYAGDYVAEAVGSELVGEIVKEGAVQATTAVIYGEDPMQAFLRGGLSAGVSAGLGKIQESLGFEVQVKDPDTGRVTTKPIPNTVSNIVAAGITAQLQGQQITPELMAGAVTRGLLTTELVSDLAAKGGVSFDDPAALAYTTAALQRVTAVALSGGSGEQAAAALQATLSAYGGAKLKEAIDNSKVGDFIGNTLDKISGDYQETEDAAQRVNDIGLRRQANAKAYEDMRTELAGLYEDIEAEKTRIAGLPTNNEAQQTEYNKSVGALNTMIENFNTKYQQYNPLMENLVTAIERDTGLLETAEADLLEAQSNMNVSIERLDDELKPLNDELTKAVTLVMDPLFNEAEYRALNDIPDGVDAYQHFLENGQYENVYTNFEQFNAAQSRNTSAMMNRVFNEAGIDPSSLNANQLQGIYNAISSAYDNPNDLEAALNNESVVADLAARVQTGLANRNDNPYRGATLDADTRARLGALGFDTSDGMDGENLTDAEKAALYAQDNQGTSTAGLASGTSWQDVASGKASVEYDADGNRVWRNVRVTEQKYDPEFGRVTVTTSYDSQGRPIGVVTKDMDGALVTPMRITIYGGNSTGTFSDTINGLLQGNASAQQINDALTDNAVIQAAGAQLGGVDNAINFASNIINLAKNTGNDALVNTAANVMKAGGGILKAFNGVVALAGVVPSETALGQFADKLVKLGEASTTEEYNQNLQELNSLMNRPSELDPDAPWYERAFEKVENIAGAIATQPTAFIAEYIGVEAMQELVPLAVGGVATLGAKGAAMAVGRTLSARMAATTGLSAAAATDLAESFGGTAAETYDRAYEVATASGMSDAEAQQYALNLAVETGTVAATMTAVTLGVGGLALEKAILGRDEVSGFLARGIDELGTRIGNGAKITIREGVTESIEEGGATAYREGHLAQLDPSINVAGEVAGAAFMGFLIGGPIAGGAYGVSQTGDMYSNLVSAMNPEVNAIITNTPNTTAGLQNAANSLTELGITGAAQTNILNNINDSKYTSTQEAESAFQTTNPDYTPTQDEIEQFIGAGTESQTVQQIAEHIDTRYFDTQEVIAAAAQEGITLTEEQAQQYVQQTDEAQAVTDLRAELDPQYTTYEESKQFFNDLGFTPTKAQIEQFVGATTEAEQQAAIATFVDPLYTDAEEARAFLESFGYTPTDQEVASFTGQVRESQQEAAIEEYTDPRVVDAEEVAAAYEALGLTRPTDADIQELVGQYAEAELAGRAEEYLPTARYNSIMNILENFSGEAGVSDEMQEALDVVKADMINALGDLGLDVAVIDQTTKNLEAAVGKIASGEEEATGLYAYIDDAVQTLKNSGLTNEEVQATVEGIVGTPATGDAEATGIYAQLEGLGTVIDNLNDLSTDDVKTIVSDAVSALNNLSEEDVNTIVEDIVGTPATDDAEATGLYATIGDLNNISADDVTTIVADALAGLENLSTDDVQTVVDGIIGSPATDDAAATGIYAALDSNTNAILDILGAPATEDTESTGLYSYIDNAVDNLGLSLQDLIGNVGTAAEYDADGNLVTAPTGIYAEIADLEAQGLSNAEAIAQIALDLGVAVTDITSALEETETALSGEIGEVAGDVSNIALTLGQPAIPDNPFTDEDESTDATGLFGLIDKYETAGQERDEAISSAIDELSTDLGVAKADILDQLGLTETNLTNQIDLLETSFTEQLGATEEALSGQITGVEEALGEQITGVEESLSADIETVANYVGKPAQDVTQTDIDFVADVIAQNQVLNEQQLALYDVTGDGIVDINDQTLLEQALGGEQVTFADTSQFTPTGVYGTIQDVQTDLTQQMEQNQEQTLDTIQQMEQNIVTNIEDEAMREGARNFLQMALQAPDAAGQQVSVRTPDPLQLRYIYDWSSIFANPSQQALFPSPYAKGGQVEDTTDKLLNIIGGK
jgi:hypothetical protein